MATSEAITIPLYLPPLEATALARLVGRLGEADCAQFAGTWPEADAMWSGLLVLQGALAFAGFQP